MWVCPIVLCLVCSGCSIYVYWLLVGMRKNKERSHPSVGNKHSKDVVVGGYLNTPLLHNIAVLLCMPLPWIGKGNGTLLQYSCLENPMDGGAWKAAVHGVTEGRTRLSDFLFTFHFHALEKEMATHSSVLAWRIPGTGEPGGLPSMGSHRVGHDWSDLAAAAASLNSLCIFLLNFYLPFNSHFMYLLSTFPLPNEIPHSFLWAIW